ncbi:hypothetical protein ACOSP7_023658 [Xanthoceras sorbifolium]
MSNSSQPDYCSDSETPINDHETPTNQLKQPQPIINDEISTTQLKALSSSPAPVSKPSTKSPSSDHSITAPSLNSKNKKKRKIADVDGEEDCKIANVDGEEDHSEKKSNRDDGVNCLSQKLKLAPFTRIWSHKNEIKLLRYVLQYKREKQVEPRQNYNDFHDFIVKLLKIDFSRMQVKEKLRRLKDKFEKNVNKGYGSKSFSNLHDKKVFRLSRKVWKRDDDTAPVKVAVNNQSEKMNSVLIKELEFMIARNDLLKEVAMANLEALKSS